MNRAKGTVGVLLAVGMILAMPTSPVWAEKEIPPNGQNFLPIDINPQASGTKLSGPLTFAYDVSTFDDFVDCPFSGILLNNMFVVLTLQQGNTIKAFSRDFSQVTPTPVKVPPSPPPGTLCFDDFKAQANYIVALIQDRVIPFFFGPCGTSTTPACPGFQVKSVSNFLSAGNITGNNAFSADVELAVK